MKEDTKLSPATLHGSKDNTSEENILEHDKKLQRHLTARRDRRDAPAHSPQLSGSTEREEKNQKDPNKAKQKSKGYAQKLHSKKDEYKEET